MRVLFIHPKCKTEEISHLQIPLGIAYIASKIKDKHDVLIYDEPVDKRNLSKVIKDFNPDILAFSFTTQSAFRSYKLLKKHKKDRFCIAGGIHPSFQYQEALDNGFDLVVIGEGEKTFSQVLKFIELKKDYSNLKGIAFKRNNKYYKTTSRQLIKNLDKINIPARDLLDMSKYEQGSITTSRGCPFNCAYCASKKYCNRTFRQRSAENVFSELKIVVEKYNKKLVHFCDDTFTINHNFVKKLCKFIIDNNLVFEWSILSRVDTIRNDLEMLLLLKKAGCKLIIFGIESGSEKILKRINKNISIKQIKEAILLTKKVGIDVKTTWIVGLPGSYKEQMESLQLMKELKPNQITIHLCVPYLGTDLCDKKDHYGIWINEHIKIEDWYNFNPSFFEGNDMNKFFRYSYISFKEIFEITSTIKNEMEKLGYILPNQYKQGKEKTIKTFMDKVKNPLIK